MRHLTDEEIQTYLDGSGGGLAADAADHLAVCEQCRGVLREYRALYRELADKSAFEVPRNLVESVTSKLGLRSVRAGFSLSGDLVLVTAATIVMLAAAVIFLDLEPVFETGAVAGRQILEIASLGPKAAYSRILAGDHTLTVFVTGIAILFFTGALDIAFKRGGRALIRQRTR